MAEVSDIATPTPPAPPTPPTPDSASTTICYLLQIPPELRLQIYRYVLIPETPLYFDSPPLSPLPQDEKSRRQNGEGDNSDEDDWVDESDSSDSSNGIPPSLLDAFRNEDGDFEYEGMDFYQLEEAYYAEGLSPDAEKIFEAMERLQLIEDGISDDEDLPQRSGRDLSILRTNHQIYNEASALFYAEATIIIELDDIFDLAKERPSHLPPGGWQYDWMEVWRYHPILNSGKQLLDGSYEYRRNLNPSDIKGSRDHRHHTCTDRRGVYGNATEIPTSHRGKLFPHVFARFQNITFNAVLEEDYVQDEALWMDDETFAFKQSDVDNFLKHVKTLKVIKDLVKLLLHSNKLNLSIIVAADIEVDSTFMNTLVESDFDSDSEDEVSRVEKLKKMEREDEIINMANRRAAELLVESTLFSPLKRLTNVHNFNIKFGDPLEASSGKATEITMSPKYEHIFAKMKNTIEGNFQDRGL